jgi:hypothetical protein
LLQGYPNPIAGRIEAPKEFALLLGDHHVQCPIDVMTGSSAMSATVDVYDQKFCGGRCARQALFQPALSYRGHPETS